MNYFEALKLFSIDNGNDVNEDYVKKIYRKLVKKHHPDVCGNDEKYKQIQDAYEEIKLFIRTAKIEQDDKNNSYKSFIISLENLLDIFNGKEVLVGDNALNKSDMNLSKIFIKIVVAVIADGVESRYSFIKPRNIKDVYDVDITLYDADINKSVNLAIKINDKTIQREMVSLKMNFRFNMDYIAQLNVAIHRVGIDDIS